MSGEVGINTILTSGTLLISMFVCTFAFWPEPPVIGMIAAAVVSAAVGPFFYFPWSKSLWLAIDVMMRPVEPGEVRPEYLPHRPTGA